MVADHTVSDSRGQGQDRRFWIASWVGDKAGPLDCFLMDLGQSVHSRGQQMRGWMVHLVGPFEPRGVVETEVSRDVHCHHALLHKWRKGDGAGAAGQGENTMSTDDS